MCGMGVEVAKMYSFIIVVVAGFVVVVKVVNLLVSKLKKHVVGGKVSRIKLKVFIFLYAT